VNYTNEPSQAALELSSQDAYDAIRLTRSKARLIEIKNRILIIPAKAFARDYVITGVGLSVCLSVCYHDN